jgi:hypothetical protein
MRSIPLQSPVRGHPSRCGSATSDRGQFLGYNKDCGVLGLENIALYVWIDELLRPLKSRSWKEARNEGGGKVMEVKNDLQSLCLKLDAQITPTMLGTSAALKD